MPLTPPEPLKTGRTSTRNLAWVVLAFDLLIVAFAGWTLAWSRAQYLENARMTTNNLAQVLEQNLHGTIKQIDLVLLSVKDEAERWGQPDLEGRVQAEIQDQFARIGLLDALRTVDEDGFINRSLGIKKAQRIGVQDRDYFQFLKSTPDAGLYISRPIIGRVSGRWVIILARRLNHPDGTFAGVVYGTITLETLGTTMSGIDVGQKGSISLRGAGRELLTRFPRHPGFEKTIGNTKIDGAYLAAAESGRPVSHFTETSLIDHQIRTYTFRRTANPTFFILVGLSQEEFLQAWHKEVLLAVLAVTGLLALSLGIALMGRAAWRRQAKTQAILESQEAKFRLLAENAADVIWTADLQGRLTYISPIVTAQRGYWPEELLGLPFHHLRLATATPNPLQHVLDKARDAPPGSQPFEGEVIEVELPKKNGDRFQAEIRLRLVWDENGLLRGFQGVTRDITERARMEAERDTLIRQLRLALAEVKNLEGMLPICGHCKKIRDDKGYWSQIETYLSAHTDATFTHGICPDCTEALREEMRQRKLPRDPA